MYICTCNYCGNLWADTNPGKESIDYPEQMLNELVNHRCPECKTDAYLQDNIAFESKGIISANDLQKYNSMKEAIRLLEGAYPEFLEEQTTGWDMMQTLRIIRDSFKK